MLRINSLRKLSLAAAAAVAAAGFIAPAAAAAQLSSHHSGGATFLFADGSVRFEPTFSGGVAVAAADANGTPGYGPF